MAQGYARICHICEPSGGEEIGALLQRGEHVSMAQRQLLDLFEEPLVERAPSVTSATTSSPTSWRAPVCTP